MHFSAAALLLPFITSAVFAEIPKYHARATPRSLDAVLVEPQEPATSPSPTPFLHNLDLRDAVSVSPYIKHLDLRQVAAAQPAAAQPAGAKAAAPVPANQPAAAVPAAAPAQGAPVAGVGGGGAPAAAQPAPGAQANPVTTIQVETVVGGVTKTVPKVYTQTFGAAGVAPSVSSGSIGLGTLTGKIGVVKTDQAKSDAIPIRDGVTRRWALLGVISSWVGVMALGGALLTARVV